jgi:colanic acid biosynthesis glycosyl transferase WcaI
MLSQIFWKPNIILVVEPPLFCAPTALLSACLCHARSWLHVQDLEVDAAFGLGILSSPWLRRFVLKIETWVMHRFDRVSTISDQMMSRLSNKGVATKAQVLFPNWVDITHIYPLQSSSPYREELDIPASNIVFLYSGNMGVKQGLDIIIESARRLSEHKNITFVMCGQGADYTGLRKLAEDLNNIHWLPLQPLDKLNDLLNMADVHLLSQKADAADLVLPSKLTGMLASGKPVLATALAGTQIAKVLESTGVVTPPENVDAFVKALLNLARNAQQRLKLGQKAREYAVEYLGHDAVLRRFEDELKKFFKKE